MDERLAPLHAIQKARSFFFTDTSVVLHKTDDTLYDAKTTARLKAVVGELVHILFLVSVQWKGWSEVGVREIDSCLGIYSSTPSFLMSLVCRCAERQGRGGPAEVAPHAAAGAGVAPHTLL